MAMDPKLAAHHWILANEKPFRYCSGLRPKIYQGYRAACCDVRPPSHKYPFPELKHIKTAKHWAMWGGTTPKEIRKLATALRMAWKITGIRT